MSALQNYGDGDHPDFIFPLKTLPPAISRICGTAARPKACRCIITRSALQPVSELATTHARVVIGKGRRTELRHPPPAPRYRVAKVIGGIPCGVVGDALAVVRDQPVFMRRIVGIGINFLNIPRAQPDSGRSIGIDLFFRYIPRRIVRVAYAPLPGYVLARQSVQAVVRVRYVKTKLYRYKES